MTNRPSSPANLPQTAVEARNLSKIYRPRNKGHAVIALDDMSLMIPRGSLFGLLGPNGAGKSTFINILAGLVFKSSGTVQIWNLDLDREPRNARAAIGVVPQELNIDPYFTPLELLNMQAGLYGLPRDETRSRRILDLVGLGDKIAAYGRHLSGGMRRRLMVAKAMIHSPPILVLDEPTAGVDVDLRRQLWANINALNAQGVTILLTTHYLEEAQTLCDRIAIIDRGKVVACEATGDLLKRISQKEMMIKVDSPLPSPDQFPAAFETLGLKATSRQSLSICYNPQTTGIDPVFDTIRNAGYEILDVSTDETDLEDIFLQLTRHDDTIPAS